MKVRVKEGQTVFYAGSRRRAGTVFTLSDPKHFSKSSMEKVAAESPAPENAASSEPTETGKPGKGGKGGKGGPQTLKDLQDDKGISGKDVGEQSVI